MRRLTMPVVQGAAPDWGPVAPGAALTAKAPRRIRLAALLEHGAGTLRVRLSRAGRARLLGGKSVRLTVSGAGTSVKRKVKVIR